MRRPNMRRTVILLPNGFTLANLFFGVFAIVAASRGHYTQAGTYVVLGGVADALDGRIARATRTGSRFGSELDSLVDAISFGLAPALIMYFAVLNREGWDWIFVFLFAACACIRLARFNVEQAGRAKTEFHGLPSPAAGMTLATYYWFSQTSLYTETMIANLPWHVMLRYIMLGLSFLMISNVSYPAVPTVGFRSLRGIVGSIVILGTVIGLIALPRQFFFPALLGYVVFGVAKTFVLGLFDRLPGAGEEDEDVDEVIVRSIGEPVDLEELGERREAGEPVGRGGLAASDAAAQARRRRRRRRHRGDRPGPPGPPPIEE